MKPTTSGRLTVLSVTVAFAAVLIALVIYLPLIAAVIFILLVAMSAFAFVKKEGRMKGFLAFLKEVIFGW